MTINGGTSRPAWNGESCPSIHAATHTLTGLKGQEMEKEIDHLRLAGLLLMLVDGDASAAIEHIETGRAWLAKEFIAHIAENVKKAQENLRAAGAI